MGPAADGAKLFAAVTDEQFTSVVITVTGNAGMALAQVRYREVPALCGFFSLDQQLARFSPSAVFSQFGRVSIAN